MASSSIGPGFLTQTAVFTQELGGNFGFIILVSVIIDAIAQLNIWRIITVAELPAQEIANKVFPGLGYFLSFLVFLGGLAFNIGNIAGAGLGLNALLGISVGQGAIISAFLVTGIFLYRDSGIALGTFAKVMGVLKICLAFLVVYFSRPPVAEAITRTVWPNHFSFIAVVTIVGGTVGGYITFAGAHRLLEAGQTGIGNLRRVNRGALGAISLSTLMRILFFLAALGVISMGRKLNPENPAASVFGLSMGPIGYKIFGLVLWASGISSVVGSAFTSVSFIKSFHPFILKYQRSITISFIWVSCLIFLIIGKPVKTLITVGVLNGFILPIALGVMLLGAYKVQIIKDYKQPLGLTILGLVVVLMMSLMSLKVFFQILGI